MIAVIYLTISLGDKGVNQSKVFAFGRLNQARFQSAIFKLLKRLAEITVCPGWVPIGSDQWTSKCWWLNRVFKKLTFDSQITCKKTLSYLSGYCTIDAFTHVASSCANLLEKKNSSKFNSHRIGLGHQLGCCFIVLRHHHGGRDVIWKRSIRLCRMIRFPV